MLVTKNNKVYTVKETETKWVVSTENGKISIAYDIPKDVCKTTEDLKKYVTDNDLF